jgi:hypothetical protein
VLNQRGVTLFDALLAFFQEHQYCGDLDGGVAGRPCVDDVYVRRGDHQERGPGLISMTGSSAPCWCAS